jgi:CNT family concentrative nucleoside transporter
MFFISYLLEYNRYMSLIGIIVLFAIAYLFSKSRKSIQPKIIFNSFLLHIIFAICMLKTTWGSLIIGKIAAGAEKLSFFAQKGIDFMFGNLSNSNLPWGFIFAVKVLPIIIFVGALTALLYHWQIIQKIIIGMNAVIRPLIGTSGVETMAVIANSILGQAESALLISNYFPLMTTSELFVMMTSGMAAISISVMVVYVALGIPSIHLLTASLLSIPASILMAKIILPETEKTKVAKKGEFQKLTHNSFDAISKGTMDGLRLAVAVAAMLISFLSLLAMCDFFLGSIGSYLNFPELSISLLFSYLFAPFAWLLGFTGSELWLAGKLLGIKIAVNEMIAFTELLKTTISERSYIILIYALCGFSNFSCIGIQIGMIGSLAPEKRHTITQLGLYALLASSLANLLSAMIVALII